MGDDGEGGFRGGFAIGEAVEVEGGVDERVGEDGELAVRGSGVGVLDADAVVIEERVLIDDGA